MECVLVDEEKGEGAVRPDLIYMKSACATVDDIGSVTERDLIAGGDGYKLSWPREQQAFPPMHELFRILASDPGSRKPGTCVTLANNLFCPSLLPSVPLTNQAFPAQISCSRRRVCFCG